MKILKLLPLFALAALIAVGCNKEDLNKQAQQESNTETKSAPIPCQVGRAVDEHGALIQPADLTPDMFAAAEMTKADVEYTIPVVFHVFGTSHTDGWTKSGTMDVARFEKVLTWITNDFNGVRNTGDPYHSKNIHADRKEFVDYLPIKFVLAKYMKDGTALEEGQKVFGGKISTSGNAGTIKGAASVIFYPASHPVAKAGPGNPSAVNVIKQIAWDNSMYMNVYITNDLYSNNQKNNSGVAWYPGTTAAGTERVVYNGTYLPGNNGDKDFTSVISHEFGHFMNLAHTFNESSVWLDCMPGTPDGGQYGDGIKDTPQHMCSSYTDSSGKLPYFKNDVKNCLGELVDFGNFMNYGIYCNFTKNQVTRMKAALQHSLRKPLWQQSNLDKVLGKGGSGVKDPATFGEKLQDINSKLGK